MKTPVQKIEELICYLPQKDIPLANRFILSRRFEDLKDLVHSAIKKVEKNNKSNNPKEEYLYLDIEKMNKLKNEVDSYLYILGYTTEEICDTEEDELNYENSENLW